jgi:hypothetical protein
MPRLRLPCRGRLLLSFLGAGLLAMPFGVRESRAANGIVFCDGLAEVAVVFVDPVLAWRGEDVEVDGVFEGDGGVGEIGGDDEDFTGVDELGGTVVELEAERALEDEGELLVRVGVAGDDASLGEDDAADHGFAAGDELSGEEGIELLGFDFAPATEGCGGCCGGHRAPFCGIKGG